MTENNENVNTAAEGSAEEIKETEAVETETAEETKADKADKSDKKKSNKLEAELEKKEKELAEANDKYMRLFAEYDNFRKRSAKERETVYSDAYTDALTSILPVLDNLERAEGCTDAEGLSKGLELTLKSFRETLEKMGVTEIEAMGKTFDPNLHNAVFHVEDENFGESEIVEVLMKGYTKGDKVIRYSMVKVAN